MIRRLLPVVLVALTAAYAVFHAHSYRVSLFSPTGLPERVQACGRSFLDSGTVAIRDDPALRDVGTFAPPLHERMEMLGRPDRIACGMEVLVGPDDQHLTAFTLQGGP